MKYHEKAHIILLVLLFTTANPAFAQSDTVVLHPVGNIALQQYSIKRISCARDGKLWLSTNRGLVRYDGNEVRVFEHNEKDSTTLRSNDVENAIFDGSQNIYVISNAHIDYLNTRTGNTLHGITGVGRVSGIVIDKDSSVWMGLNNGGLMHYYRNAGASEYYPFRPGIFSIQQDRQDNTSLWLGTSDGIYRFDKSTHIFSRLFHCRNRKDSTEADLAIVKMEPPGSDTIWFVAASSGIGSYKTSTGAYTIYPTPRYNAYRRRGLDNTRFLQRKNDSEFYIGTAETTPGIFNSRTHRYNFNTKVQSYLPALQTDDFIVDSSGNYWCSIFGQLYLGRAIGNTFATTILPHSAFEDLRAPHVFKTVVWDKEQECYYACFENSAGMYLLDKNLRYQKTIPARNADQTGNATDYRAPYTYTTTHTGSCIYRIHTGDGRLDSIVLPAAMFDHGDEHVLDGLQIDKEAHFAYISVDRVLYQLDLGAKAIKVLEVQAADSMSHGDNSHFSWYQVDDDDNIWVGGGGSLRIYDPVHCLVNKVLTLEKDVRLLQLYNIRGKGIMLLSTSAGIQLYDYKSNRQFKFNIANGLITLLNLRVACVNNILFAGSNIPALQYMPLDNVLKGNTDRRCYLSEVRIFNDPVKTSRLPEYLHSLTLPHDRNFITLTFAATEFQNPEKLEFRYRLDDVDKLWTYTGYLNRTITYQNLKPGNYIFRVAVKKEDGSWGQSNVHFHISVLPAWWQETWFTVVCIVSAVGLAWLLIQWRMKTIRKEEKEKIMHEKELLELEAKALRAQMNPHFIFNCMNSIKSLIQRGDRETAITYLTTFSKLIRTIFQNSDKREITLYDEIDTCRLYVQLESLRFDNKFEYKFTIDETTDLKSIMVPALIIQPFVENAIWHGLMAKEGVGLLQITVRREGEAICCTIDDNGIGREISRLNKFQGNKDMHESKGVSLTQSRINLDNLLNKRDGDIFVTDKKNARGESAGTMVTIIFHNY